MQSQYPAAKEEFEERKAELIEAGEWLGFQKNMLTLCFGNQYETVENPKPSVTKPGIFLDHRWCMFLTINNDK